MTNTAQLITSIQSYVTDAQQLCEQGAFVELAGMDERVNEICTHIQALEPQESQQYAADLDQLMQSLEQLQNLMQGKRDALGEELNGTNKHHKAAKAYAQSEHSHIPSPPQSPAEAE